MSVGADGTGSIDGTSRNMPVPSLITATKLPFPKAIVGVPETATVVGSVLDAPPQVMPPAGVAGLLAPVTKLTAPPAFHAAIHVPAPSNASAGPSELTEPGTSRMRAHDMPSVLSIVRTPPAVSVQARTKYGGGVGIQTPPDSGTIAAAAIVIGPSATAASAVRTKYLMHMFLSHCSIK